MSDRKGSASTITSGFMNDRMSSVGVMICTENVSSFLRSPRIFRPSRVVTVMVSKPIGMTSPGRRISRSSAEADRDAPMRDRLGPSRPPRPPTIWQRPQLAPAVAQKSCSPLAASPCSATGPPGALNVRR